MSLWDFIYRGFNTRHYTLVHGFCFLKLLPYRVYRVNQLPRLTSTPFMTTLIIMSKYNTQHKTLPMHTTAKKNKKLGYVYVVVHITHPH